MSYLAKNPDVWAQAQPDDTPAPAPFRLSIIEDRGPFPFGSSAHNASVRSGAWFWSLGSSDGDVDLASGTAHSKEQAEEDGEAAAHRLGLHRVYDGWVSAPDQAFTT